MLRAFAEWKGDPDIQVHEKIIQDTAARFCLVDFFAESRFIVCLRLIFLQFDFSFPSGLERRLPINNTLKFLAEAICMMVGVSYARGPHCVFFLGKFSIRLGERGILKQSGQPSKFRAH